MAVQVVGIFARVARVFTLTAKLVLIADNCPPLRRSELEYYAMLSKVCRR